MNALASPDSEKLVLGLCLQDAAKLYEATAVVKPEEFSLDSHRKIFATMADMAATGKPVDYMTVATELGTKSQLQAVGGVQPCGQHLWLWLLTGPATCIIPGVIYNRGPLSMAELLKWDLEGFQEAFQEVLALGMAEADFEAPLIFIPNAIKYNPPQSPNVVTAWADTWGEIPECALKVKMRQTFRDFLEGMGEAFLKAFDKAYQKTTPNQEQEQYQEQYQKQEQENPRAPADKSRIKSKQNGHAEELNATDCAMVQAQQLGITNDRTIEAMRAQIQLEVEDGDRAYAL